MANLFQSLQGYLGGAKSSVVSAISSVSDDFADFATPAASSVTAASHTASSAFNTAATPSAYQKPPGIFGAFNGIQGKPYTKWYRVWERTTIEDFYQELAILPLLTIVILVSLWGSRVNKQRAKQWAATNVELLESEYAVVGYGGGKRQPSTDEVQGKGLAKALAESGKVPAELYKQRAQNEFTTYCTGRQNVAWLDVKISFYKRYNPLVWLGELLLSFVFDTMAAPAERLEATAYTFDGKEKSLVLRRSPNQAAPSTKDSTYDGFVWAIVHKDKMRQLRDDRYDLSLTTTKDHPKLPGWLTVMSESAEVTEAMITPDLVKAVTEAGDDLEALIVSDQPIDAPRKLNDLTPRKRISLAMRLSSSSSPSSLFAYFLRLPDHLVTGAHFRPEALRKVRATREAEMHKIRKTSDEAQAEERRLAGDKLKKEERDRKLSRLSADEQRKFLEKEKDKEARKMNKKRTMRA